MSRDVMTLISAFAGTVSGAALMAIAIGILQ